MNNSLSFVFKGYDSDIEKGEALFHYQIMGDRNIDFTEKIYFPPVTDQIPTILLKSILDNLMLILGISYWKLYCPKEIIIESNFLTYEQANFWNIVYTKGLGEFFYKNNIDFRGLVEFPYVGNVQEKIISFPRKERVLLGLGGGKDSIVAAEILKSSRRIFPTNSIRAESTMEDTIGTFVRDPEWKLPSGQDKPFNVLTIATSQIQENVARVMDKKPIVIKRELDPKLFELNKQKETYNGHIPISAIYAFFGLMTGIFYDYNSFVIGNEKSANYGNVTYLGEVINHQWSKSEEFEKLFRKYVQKFITADISYSSPLRNMNEMEVTREFIKYPKYFKVFSSCNKNFKIHGALRRAQGLWCGKCAKCLFVFTSLAAFLPKKEVLDIFGKNLFEDKSLVPLFEELIGIRNFKPFECVGTPEEVRQALEKISEKGEFNDTILMKHFKSS